MKPKVLIIPENFPTDENPVAGIFMKDQIHALSSKFELSVFNSNPWYRGVYEQIDGARYYDLHLFSNRLPTLFKFPGYAWWEYQSLQMAKKIPKPDRIHLHGAAMRGGWVMRLAQFWKVPYFVTEHTGPWSAISGRPRIFKRAKAVLENADAVVSVSKHLEAEMKASGVRARRWVVTGNPVDTSFFYLRNTPLSATKTILFIGRLDAFKGALRTLKAFHKITGKVSDYKLIIAGEGAEAGAIRNYIDTENLSDRVGFQNRSLSRIDMRALFHKASYLVFPSLFESFGLVAAEAMATGLPVVITDRTGPQDFTTDLTAIAVQPDSVEAIAEAMLEMCLNLTRFDPRQIRDFIVKHFGFEAYREKMMAGGL